MVLPIEDLTPRQIVAELDKYIVGQNAAKRAVAVAMRNRYRRQRLPEEQRQDVLPKNILMVGPTGVGKTEIARRLAQLARAPFVKVEATKFTEVGYVGRDVESMIRELVSASVRLVEQEFTEHVRSEAERRTWDRLAELLDREPGRRRKKKVVEPEPVDVEATDEQPGITMFGASWPAVADEYDWEEEEKQRVRRRAKLAKRIEAGELDGEMVDIDVEDASNPFVQVFSPQGIEEMGFDVNSMANPFGTKRSSRRMSVSEAKQTIFDEEARGMVERLGVHKEALRRAEQTGIIFLDEIDKVAGSTGGSGPDVSREGVQRDLLPIIEGSTVQTKFGPVKTDHILFIAAGAFHISKPGDLIPELQGRLPIRVELESLGESDLKRILREPKNALTRQYEQLLGTDGVKVTFTDDAIETIAHIATEVNSTTENIGARRLHTMMEKLLEEPLFEAPDWGPKEIVVDAAYAERKLRLNSPKA